jgi:hypothetical protein
MLSHLAMTVLIATGFTAGLATVCAATMAKQSKIMTVRIRTGQRRATR